MKTEKIVAICLSLATAFGIWTNAHAGTLPDISGTWYANGNRAARCSISQSGDSVSLTNDQGATATGRFVNAGTIATNWGYFGRHEYHRHHLDGFAANHLEQRHVLVAPARADRDADAGSDAGAAAAGYR